LFFEPFGRPRLRVGFPARPFALFAAREFSGSPVSLLSLLGRRFFDLAEVGLEATFVLLGLVDTTLLIAEGGGLLGSIAFVLLSERDDDTVKLHFDFRVLVL
jgi:hypothetical protein